MTDNSNGRELFRAASGGVKLGLAPMAGVTDMGYRLLCRAHGCDFATSEMISAKGFVLNRNPGESIAALYAVAPFETTGVQLFGSEPETMAQAAAAFERRDFSFIDINMGCPVHKVTANGEGSALMKTPALAEAIVRAVVGAVKKPVTVKIRAGWDAGHINAPEFAAMLQECGVAAICVHGRTREQFYSGSADLNVIRDVKRAVSIPVIGNGDVTDGESARRMLEYTGCDALAIGRGAQGDPFVFDKIKAELRGEKYEYTPRDRLNAIRTQYDMLMSWRGVDVAVREMRKHIAWYLHGLRGSAQLKNRLLTETDPVVIDALLSEFLSNCE